MNSPFASLIKDQRQITLSVLGDSLSYGYMVPAGYIHMLMKDAPEGVLYHSIHSSSCLPESFIKNADTFDLKSQNPNVDILYPPGGPTCSRPTAPSSPARERR